MRARLHAQGPQLGFLREGTHQLCDAGATGQLLPATADWIAAAEGVLIRDGLEGLAAVEISENVQGTNARATWFCGPASRPRHSPALSTQSR